MNDKIEKIKKQADRVIRFDDWKMKGLGWSIGAMHVAQNGYYTYISHETKEKIFIER